ncbi:unnamed protein product [Lampetra fluviatilis]
MKNAAVERARRDVPRVRRFWKTAPGPAIWGVPRVYVAVSDVIFPATVVRVPSRLISKGRTHTNAVVENVAGEGPGTARAFRVGRRSLRIRAARAITRRTDFSHSRRANGSINLGDKKCPFSASAVHRGLVRGSRSGCGDCGTEIRELAGVD